MGTKAAFLKAAELVRKGWMQGDYARFNGRPVDGLFELAVRVRDGEMPNCVCGLGALKVASLQDADASYIDLTIRARKALPGKDFECPSLYAWNDMPGRTAEEVAQLFEKCAAREGED